jgi:hypothetical protein
VFSELLHIQCFARMPDHHVYRIFRERRPELVALAARLLLHERAQATLDEVLALVWGELVGYQSG